MTQPVPMAELWRGDLLESIHLGHAVICDDTGQIVEAWGNPDAVIYPRSSCKMVQALPLVESGVSLTDEQIALACASHQGQAMHTERVALWLNELGLGEDDMRCGVHEPWDTPTRHDLLLHNGQPCQLHNNCSGKHAGFLTMNKHIGGNAEYHEVDHPVQQGCKAALEDLTQMDTFGYGIDGCSAPNFQTTVHGLARAMSFYASATDRNDTRSRAAARLTDAMRKNPALVAGDGRACTELMQATDNKVAIKLGAEGAFVAIIPEKKLGVALKIADGAQRASEAAIAAILVKLGVLDANHPLVAKRMDAPQSNCNHITWGKLRAADTLR